MSNSILVSLLLGPELFAGLLIALPDAFYGLHRDQQEQYWQTSLTAVNQGERDPLKLAALFREPLPQLEAIRA